MVQLHHGAFESDVVPDSGKTAAQTERALPRFESDVVPDSGKTEGNPGKRRRLFESDVVPDSGKTLEKFCGITHLFESLRVM